MFHVLQEIYDQDVTTDGMRRLASQWIANLITDCAKERVRQGDWGEAHETFFDTDNWLAYAFATVCGFELQTLHRAVDHILDTIPVFTIVSAEIAAPIQPPANDDVPSARPTMFELAMDRSLFELFDDMPVMLAPTRTRSLPRKRMYLPREQLLLGLAV
jgi:hypothetical protein